MFYLYLVLKQIFFILRLLFFIQVLDSLTLLLTHSSLRGSQDSLETVVNLLVELASMERSQLIRLNNSRHFGTADLAVR
jgi:hypothetical protein